MSYNAERIRAWLQANKRSQAWLAEKVGVHTGTVNRWLQGHLQPTASKIILLERIMAGTDSSELPQAPVRLKLPAEVWGLVEALAAAQGVSAEEYVRRCAAQLAEELASLLINANRKNEL